MKRIGLISDTHGTFDDTLRGFLTDVDEIWHAGDIGSLELAEASPPSNLCGPSAAIPTAARCGASGRWSTSSGAKRRRCS